MLFLSFIDLSLVTCYATSTIMSAAPAVLSHWQCPWTVMRTLSFQPGEVMEWFVAFCQSSSAACMLLASKPLHNTSSC